MKEKEFIIITRYDTAEVIICEYDSSTVDSYEEYYEILNEEHDLNISDSNSSCMIVKGELNIKIL
jgi:hypothetical protein